MVFKKTYRIIIFKDHLCGEHLKGDKSEPMERSQEDLLQTWQEMMAAQTGEAESIKG